MNQEEKVKLALIEEQRSPSEISNFTQVQWRAFRRADGSSVVPVGDLRSRSPTVIRGKVVEGCQHSNVPDFVRSQGPLSIHTRIANVEAALRAQLNILRITAYCVG